jgi:putative membrane protein insertion efficiency factor
MMVRQAALALIRFYQAYLRVYLPAACRYQPTCSEYARQAVMRFGLLAGAYKALRRILRCHPFTLRAGYDPVR